MSRTRLHISNLRGIKSEVGSATSLRFYAYEIVYGTKIKKTTVFKTLDILVLREIYAFKKPDSTLYYKLDEVSAETIKATLPEVDATDITSSLTTLAGLGFIKLVESPDGETYKRTPIGGTFIKALNSLSPSVLPLNRTGQ